MYLILQIMALFLASVVLASFFRNNKAGILVSVILGFFCTIQIASVILGGTLADYKFFIHINADIFNLQWFFLKQILLIITALALSIITIYYISRKWQFKRKRQLRINSFTLPVCIVLMLLEGGVINNLYGVVKIKTAEDKTFQKALKDLNIEPELYVSPDDIEASAGKNIIVISLESFEKAYLAEELKHLTPNLRRLKKDWTFYDVKPALGSDWTAGSIYTEICGFPSFFKSETNKIFHSAYDTKITGLGHILNKAGYDVTYMLGNSEFAGVKDMLNTFKFNIISNDQLKGKYDILNEWGIHDKDLFNEAKHELKKAKSKRKPFALFMSTISTHFPNGVYDKRFKGLIEDQGSELEFMVAAVDYLIGDLYSFLEKEGMLANTSIYLFPDHLLMGKTSTVLGKFKGPRGLYLLTNAHENDLTYSRNDPVLQIDIPKIILEGAKVEHNGKFLTDFINKDEKLKFIHNNQSNLVALNESSLSIESYKDGIKIYLAGNEVDTTTELLINSSSLSEKIKGIEGEDVLCEVLFDQNMRLIRKGVVKKPKFFHQNDNTTKLLINKKNDVLYAYLKKGTKLGLAKKGEDEINFTGEEISLFSEWDIESKLTQTPVTSPFENSFVSLTSTGGPDPVDGKKSEIKLGEKSYTLTRGINIFFKENGIYKVESFDTYGNPSHANKIIKKLKKLSESKDFYALVVHDSGERLLKKYKDELNDLGFNLLTYLKFRNAYIAYSYNGLVSEFKHLEKLSFKLPVELNNGKRSDYQIKKDSKNPDKFIAHAGGAISRIPYTNSLEALNNSYKNGFKLFELDIIKTKDGKYVASHDWNKWAWQVKYDGPLPPSTEEFHKHKIHGRFTSLDIDGINKWFKEHPDAILITDKVNDPKDFSEKFIDKNRLIMELFTLKAVLEGAKAGINVMVSECVLPSIKGDKVDFFTEHNIKYMCVSRKSIKENEALYLRLKENGVKNYIFHINFEKGKDESYGVLRDFDYVYGMYADNYSFR